VSFFDTQCVCFALKQISVHAPTSGYGVKNESSHQSDEHHANSARRADNTITVLSNYLTSSLEQQANCS